MPRENRAQLHLRVHDEIHHEQVRQHRRRFAHVLVQGISLQHAVSDLRIRAQRVGIERVGVVVANCLQPAHTGKDALASAAEACHDMMGARAKTDHKIRCRDGMIDPHGRIVRGRAEVDKILCLAVVVFDLHAVKNLGRHQRAQLLLAASQVRAVCHDNGQPFIRNAARRMQIRHQMRNDQILPHPEPRHVAHDQRNLCARWNLLAQRLRSDGVFQTLNKPRADVLHCGRLVSVQHRKHRPLVQRHRHAAFSVCELIIFHIPRLTRYVYTIVNSFARIIYDPA